MNIRPIRTWQDHQESLAEIERLWGAKAGTPECNRLEVLAALVDEYEREHLPIPAPDTD